MDDLKNILIGALIASAGWVFNAIYDWFKREKEYKNNKQMYLLKEKVEAAKKVAAYYFQSIEIDALFQWNLGLFEHDMKFAMESMKHSLISKYRDKLEESSTLEHHHINLFYNLEIEELLMNESKKVEKYLLELNSILIPKGDNERVYKPEEEERIKQILMTIKNIGEKRTLIFKNEFDKIKKDIQKLSK